MSTATRPAFEKHILQLDAAQACEEIAAKLKNDILGVLRKRGAVIGVSGGIDSSVTLALAVRALGAERVLGVLLPERDSSTESAALAAELAGQFGVQTVTEDITAALEGFGCYLRRNEAVRRVYPDFDPLTDRVKLVLPQDVLNSDLLAVSSLVRIKADGTEQQKRLSLKDYLQIVAASNFKQRTRMAMLYYHAERLNYAVVGTPNKHEHAQGFFVKHGDGGADVMPIVHLYKTQVYQLARHLDVPESIVGRQPTADTYSAEATQQEFFFQLPFELMDLLWYGYENEYTPEEIGPALHLTAEQVERAFRSFARKERTTAYLRMPPLRPE